MTDIAITGLEGTASAGTLGLNTSDNVWYDVAWMVRRVMLARRRTRRH